MSRGARLLPFLPFLIFALLGLPFVEYLTDDTFIFLRFARNFAQGLGLSFNPGEPVYGFTSPLWVLLLTVLAAAGLPLVAAAKALALLLGGAAVGGFAVLARRRLEPLVAGFAVCAFAANAWLVRWTWAAMETALVTALIVWGLARHAVEAEDDARAPLAAALFALAVLARPETALLLVFSLASDLAGGRRARRRALAGAAGAALILVPWLAYARLALGTFIPLTAEAKGRLDPAVLDADPLMDVARSVMVTSGLEALLLAAGVVAWVVAWVVSARARGGGDARSGGDARMGSIALRSIAFRRHGVPLLWLGTLPLLYVITGFDVLSRYALPLIPVVILYGFMVLARYGPRRAMRAAAGALLTAVLIQNALVLAFIVYPHTHRFTRGVEGCLAELGRWTWAHTPNGTTVAIADIGAFGYYSNRRVLDLAGLVSPEILPIVNEHSIEEIAAGLLFKDHARPDYLVDRHAETERLAGTMGGTFEPIRSCRIEGLGVRSPEPVAYTLYRLHWDRYEAFAHSALEVR